MTLWQETLGVNVTTIGETNDFPAFYSPKSGLKVCFRLRLEERTLTGNYIVVILCQECSRSSRPSS